MENELTTTVPPVPVKKPNLETEDIIGIVASALFAFSVVTSILLRSYTWVSKISFFASIILWATSLAMVSMRFGKDDEKKIKTLPEEVTAIFGLVLMLMGALAWRFGSFYRFSDMQKFVVALIMVGLGFLAFVISAIISVRRTFWEQVEKNKQYYS